VAGEVGYPVVMKILSADIAHKTTSAACGSASSIRRACRNSYQAILHDVRARAPDAALEAC